MALNIFTQQILYNNMHVHVNLQTVIYSIEWKVKLFTIYGSTAQFKLNSFCMWHHAAWDISKNACRKPCMCTND